MNDTHPAMAVAELMRILLNEAHLGWDEAWDLTVHRTFKCVLQIARAAIIDRGGLAEPIEPPVYGTRTHGGVAGVSG
jgi:hypothetical protein